MFVDIGLAIKATSPFRNTIVISLAGDVDYYIPPRRAFTEGSYEVTTCPLNPGCGELLLDNARAVLMELKTKWVRSKLFRIGDTTCYRRERAAVISDTRDK